MNTRQPNSKLQRNGFTLIEVVLALGVFLISVMALIGLLGPMLQSVDEVEQIDEITSIVNTVDAFLHSSPDIAFRNGSGAITTTKFEAIYAAVSSTSNNEATIFVFRYYDGSNVASNEVRLAVGFSPDEATNDIPPGTNSTIDPGLFNQAAGPIYRVVLTASPVTPLLPTPLRTVDRSPDAGTYAFTEADVADYTEGYLAFEARVFAEDGPGPNATFSTTTNLTALNEIEPDFTFNTAIVR